MTRGIPGFVGGRLRIARELRGVTTASALADMIGVSRQAVSLYENDRSSPTEVQLERIARTLDMPISFFLLRIPDSEGSQPFFRSLSSSVAADRARAGSLHVILSDITRFLLEYVEMPLPSIPKLPVIGTFRNWSIDQIEIAAEAVRKWLGVNSGPLPNLLNLLEHQGFAVGRERLADRELDGLSSWLDGRPYILLHSGKSAARSRLDLAHELGHLILHRGVDRAAIEDRKTFQLLEKQAFRFGSALLLPSEEFSNDLYRCTPDEFVALKPRWQVSAAAMVFRATDLGILSGDQATSMWRRFQRSGWKVREPLEDVVAQEVPTLLKSAAVLLRDSGYMGGPEIIERACVPKSEFLSLTGLPADFAERPEQSRIVQLRSLRTKLAQDD